MSEGDTLPIDVGGWHVLHDAAATVRRAVFVREQGFPEADEWDEHDAGSVHAVAYADGVPVATGRLLPDARIGRMAVLAPFRGRGTGGAILQRLVAVAIARGEREVRLAAQVTALPFYARHGFVSEGDRFDDTGVPHQWMRRRLV